MAFWNKRKTENRADGMAGFGDSLLTALLGKTTINRETALEIPALSGGIDLIASTLASTPVKLYKMERENNGKSMKAVEMPQDKRLRLLNDSPDGLMSAAEMWKAVCRDYYLGKGGYIYIEKSGKQFKNLHFVREQDISITKNEDPIFHDGLIWVGGKQYEPYKFIRILRNSTNGLSGCSLIDENKTLLELNYRTLTFQRNLIKRGGNKKGFFKSSKPLNQNAIDSLKAALREQYSDDNADKFLLLNADMDFKESSATSVEMQLDETKKSNLVDITELLHISAEVITGKAKAEQVRTFVKLAVVPFMKTIESALNRDFLTENEKASFYWAFDTKELMKGDMKERFEAYKAAVEAHFMQVNEVRYAEDLPPLPINFIQLGLDTVLLDVDSNTIYTPNTNQSVQFRPNNLEKKEENANGNRESG